RRPRPTRSRSTGEALSRRSPTSRPCPVSWRSSRFARSPRDRPEHRPLPPRRRIWLPRARARGSQSAAGRTLRCSSGTKLIRAAPRAPCNAPGPNRPGRTLLGGRLAALADAGGLAAQVAQVVQLGATDAAAGGDLDLLDHRGVHGEGALDTDAVADLADREGLPGARALPPDHDALEDLDTGPVALGDPDVHVERVARAEVGNIGAQLGLLKLLDSGVHLSDSSSVARRGDGHCGSRGRILLPGSKCVPLAEFSAAVGDSRQRTDKRLRQGQLV